MEQGFSGQVNVALRTAVDLDLFELIDTPVSATKLVSTTGANPVLLQRLLRVLAAFHYLTEVSMGCYASTPLTVAMCFPPARDAIKMIFDTSLPIEAKLPAYLASTGYRNPGSDPSGVSPAVFTFGHEYFDYMAIHPEMMAHFNSAMKIQDLSPASSKPSSPFGERLRGCGAEDVILVDVGGGHGGYLEALAENASRIIGESDIAGTAAGCRRTGQIHY